MGWRMKVCTTDSRHMTKMCSTGTGHMTKMAAMPIYGKNLKHLLRNQKADNLENWYAPSGARVLPSLFK